MIKFLILTMFVFISSVSNASFELKESLIPQNLTEDFIDNLEDCDKHTETIKNKEHKIIGLDDNDNCIVETYINDNKVTCSFPENKLDDISDFFEDELEKKEDLLGGDYDIDFKMKMPEIDLSDMSEDNFSFNFKMEMPDIKIEKIKTKTEVLIEGYCK